MVLFDKLGEGEPYTKTIDHGKHVIGLNVIWVNSFCNEECDWCDALEKRISSRSAHRKIVKKRVRTEQFG